MVNMVRMENMVTMASIAAPVKYSEIQYFSCFLTSTVSGTLFSNVSFSPTAMVTASFQVPVEYGLECKKLELDINFLQSATKTNRSKRSQTLNKGRVFYRGFSSSLDAQIQAYSLEANDMPIPVLLLNDLSLTGDKFYGDCVIQPVVRVFYPTPVKIDNVLMTPSKMSGVITETIGLSFLLSPSITDVVDEIITTCTNEIVNTFVAQYNMIDPTVSLTSDIKRYLEYAYYGA